jgi:hypothetical protein
MRQAACDESQRGGNSARAMAEELFKLRGDKFRFLKMIPFSDLIKKIKKDQNFPSRKVNVW